MKETKKTESLKLILLYALIFLGTFGGFFILRALTNTEYPIMVVVSESMEPTLGVGDYIFVKGLTQANVIEIGNIIVFARIPGDYIVHRVIDIITREDSIFFITKGDNNPGPDPWQVSEFDVMGKVYGRVPLIGYFSLFERTSGGILTIIALIGIVFFIDYLIPPREKEETINASANSRRELTYITYSLLLFSLIPYPLFYFLKDHWVLVEVLSLLCWYSCNLLLPIAIDDEENSLMIWLFHFVLLVLPIGSDLIYRLMGITPRDWWKNTHGTVPLTWFLTGETKIYYRYLSTLCFFLLPGCLLFFYSWRRKRRRNPILV